MLASAPCSHELPKVQVNRGIVRVWRKEHDVLCHRSLECGHGGMGGGWVVGPVRPASGRMVFATAVTPPAPLVCHTRAWYSM